MAIKSAVTKSGGFYTQQWIHIVITSSTSAYPVFNVYVNGTLSSAFGSTQTSNFGGVTVDKTIVGGFKDGTYGFNGYMDCVRVFTTLLSASDITTLYNSGVPY